MKPWLKKTVLLVGGGLIGCLILAVLGLLVLVTRYHNRIYPGITISQVSVGGLDRDQANQALTQSILAYTQSWPGEFIDINNNTYSVALEPNVVSYNIDATVDKAFNVGRKIAPSSLTELVFLLRRPPEFTLQTEINPVWFDAVTASLSAQINLPAIPPQLEIVQTQQREAIVQVNPGRNGQKLDEAGWKESLNRSFVLLTKPNADLPIELEINNITSDQIALTQDTATKLLKADLELTFSPDNRLSTIRSWQLAGSELIEFVRFDGDFDKSRIEEYLAGVAESVNQQPKDAKFQFDEVTGKVIEFVPAENGVALNISKSQELMYQALVALSSNQTVESIALAFDATSPDVSLSEVNRLGIKEKIGVGTSTYKGSIASRVHNVALGAARINGTLIKPGEEFSFNQAIGDISAATGYQAAYIIQNGRTELGDGGGVCQDSTTIFRAALDAGLPITNRRGHAYRVGYYEQDAKPGLDATVFSPTTDFKFLNDTPAHILVQAEADSVNRRLTVTLYGTSDGRTSEIVDHIVWDVTPPPPDVYVDDPTLAPGQVKQIDWKAAGGKAKFTYRVTRNGEVLQDKTFLSTYKPWAAVYLRGPQP
jgi:vancomycin resistance protein YoaR